MDEPHDFRTFDAKPLQIGSRLICLGIDYGRLTVEAFNEKTIVIHIAGGSFSRGIAAPRGYSRARRMVLSIHAWHAQKQGFTGRMLIDYPTRGGK